MPGGLETTPTDELTGLLPLPVLTKSSDYYFRRSDYHHHLHPKRSIELGYQEDGTKLPIEDPARLEGVALRQSRGQHIPVWLHDRYHDIFQGPNIPNQSRAKFTTVILACAGVVPRQAIDLYKPGNFRVINLQNRRHSFLSNRIHYEGANQPIDNRQNKRDNIGRYIANYAIANSLADALTESQVFSMVEDFMAETDERKKMAQGKYILSQAVDASVAELMDLHTQLKAEGMVSRTSKRLGEVALDYFPESRFSDYLGPLEVQLQSLLAI